VLQPREASAKNIGVISIQKGVKGPTRWEADALVVRGLIDVSSYLLKK
jgi:hypothetical protein